MKTAGGRDLAALLALAASAFFLAPRVNIPETVVAAFRKDGLWGWDRFLAAGLVLAVGIALYALRRFRELCRETRRRESVERSLRDAQEALRAQLAARTRKLHESVEHLRHESTQRRSAEGKLRASEGKYGELLENANDLIHLVSPEGNLIYTNRSWRAATGYSEADLDDVTLLDLVSAETRADAEKALRRSQVDGLPAHTELTLVAKNGRRLALEGTTTWKHVDGKPAVGQGVFRDITERRQNEKRLRAQYGVARALADSASIEEAAPKIIRSLCAGLDWDLGAFWTIGPGGASLRCLAVERAGETTDGSFVRATRSAWFARGEGLLGRVWAYEAPAWRVDVQADEDFGRAGEAREAGLRAAFVFPILVRPGVLGVMEFYSTEAREPDLVLLAMAASLGSQIGQFIEAKRAEEGFRAAKETAEAANRAKSRFLATMSHELRTPLNSVIGFANVLLRNRPGSPTGNDRLFLNRILENGKHLLGLINQILDLSKIESGKVEVERAVVPVGDLVRKTFQYCEAHLRDRGVRLVAEVPDQETYLETDPEKLKQILINLIGNALKFTERGSVTVRLVCDPVTGQPERIDVADTGIGIPKERQEAIFEAFQQAENATSRKYGGTGLGLTISRSLCSLLGFALDLESEPGRGSTFRVHFDGSPAARAPKPAPDGEEGAEPAVAKEVPCLN